MSSETKPRTRAIIKGMRIFLALIISLAIAAILIKTRPRPTRQTAESPPPLVEVIEAKKITSHMIIKSYGTVRSGQELAVTAEIKGKVVEMAAQFEEGNYFPKGTFLIQIDPRSYRLTAERVKSEIQRVDADLARITQEKRNLQASLQIAQEDVALAKAELDRNLSLAQRKVVSQNALDQMRQKWLTSRIRAQEIRNSLALIGPRLKLLKAQRRSVLNQLQEAQLDLERTEIRAPFNCRVAQKRVEVEQYVTAGTQLANIYSVEKMEVEVRIPPQDVVWLHFNSGRATTLKGKPPAQARIIYNTSAQTLSWEGSLSRITAQMEESTRTLPVVISIENGRPRHGHPIVPGMFVTVEIEGKRVDDLFVLPQQSVHENNTVYLVNAGKVAIKSVNVLRRMENQVYVKEGLSDGDRIITRLPGVATEGMKVRTKLRGSGRESSP